MKLGFIPLPPGLEPKRRRGLPYYVPLKADEFVAAQSVPAVVIVNASSPERTAAQRLQHYLQRIIKGHVDLREGIIGDVRQPGTTMQIAVGYYASRQLAGLSSSTLDFLGEDGYVVTSNKTQMLRRLGSVAISGASSYCSCKEKGIVAMPFSSFHACM